MKRFFGWICIIEFFVSIFLFGIIKQQEPLWAIFLISTIWGVLAYLCFKKPKDNIQNEISSNSYIKTETTKNIADDFHNSDTNMLDNKQGEEQKTIISPTISATNSTTMNELLSSKQNSSNNSDSYIETENIICHTSKKTISDEEVAYLTQLGYEKALENEKNSTNPAFHRSKQEDELSFNFMMKYGSQVDVLMDKVSQLYNDAYGTNDLSKRISLLEEAIKAFEKTKRFCYSKGKGGTIYFQDMWEYMHNSQNSCFSYVDNIKGELETAIFERDEFIPEILLVISKNDGILQKDIYKELSITDKSYVQKIIRRLESENKIQRIKKFNSYELHIIK